MIRLSKNQIAWMVAGVVFVVILAWPVENWLEYMVFKRADMVIVFHN